MCLSILPAAMLLAMVVTPAAAQSRAEQEGPEEPPPLPAPRQQVPGNSTAAGRTGDSGVGEVGQRQTRERAAPNVPPLARINGRINNRVQNRISNRIDRTYNPTPDATDPFANAEKNQKRGTRPRR
jgi:hypothetical protein